MAHASLLWQLTGDCPTMTTINKTTCVIGIAQNDDPVSMCCHTFCQLCSQQCGTGLFSKSIGGGRGISFASNMTGPITGVKVWEHYDYEGCISRIHCIGGIQFRYDTEWSDVTGRTHGMTQEIELFDEEFIIQLSGRYDDERIYLLIFVTSRGRSLIAGTTNGDAFNFYPVHPDSELQMLGGHYNGTCITSLAAHWGLPYDDNNK
ncbi:zymogen granule membrane protein 16-like [Boleophthalmus pectinirostris]|uniref:zymogen granule membrane protein 16-like n=1 Tax=Boleophthalmus pectinirostris TaxID=150288 RepID=UPI00242E4928|nr:zymogen granule membrane protein 16-like [Boleophthalmus pectinirostris]